MNQTYTVKKGDTLYSISNKYGVTVNELYNLNNLKSNNLAIGQTLLIPNTNNSFNNTQEYIVKQGDTLYGISNQYGVSVIDLYNLNNLKNNNLTIGQVLLIPTKEGTNPGGVFIYTVKKGDSLYNIAKRYETTVDKIIQTNNLKSTSLSIGQQLLIPETGETVTTPPSFINYVVKKGDSLYSIAREYNLTVDQILKDNNLNTTNLSIGQNLKIRTTPTTTIEECLGIDYTPPTTYQTYTVKKGDSLYTIAKNFNTSVDNIKRINNLNTNLLTIGQVLKI